MRGAVLLPAGDPMKSASWGRVHRTLPPSPRRRASSDEIGAGSSCGGAPGSRRRGDLGRGRGRRAGARTTRTTARGNRIDAPPAGHPPHNAATCEPDLATLVWRDQRPRARLAPPFSGRRHTTTRYTAHEPVRIRSRVPRSPARAADGAGPLLGG